MWRDEWENERNACEGYDMDGCDVRDWFESAELQWEWYEDYNPWDDDCQICGGECRL
jgi:hypothetical protein